VYLHSPEPVPAALIRVDDVLAVSLNCSDTAAKESLSLSLSLSLSHLGGPDGRARVRGDDSNGLAFFPSVPLVPVPPRVAVLIRAPPTSGPRMHKSVARLWRILGPAAASTLTSSMPPRRHAASHPRNWVELIGLTFNPGARAPFAASTAIRGKLVTCCLPCFCVYRGFAGEARLARARAASWSYLAAEAARPKVELN